MEIQEAISSLPSVRGFLRHRQFCKIQANLGEWGKIVDGPGGSVGLVRLIPVAEIIRKNYGMIKDQGRQVVTGENFGLEGIVGPDRLTL